MGLLEMRCICSLIELTESYYQGIVREYGVPGSKRGLTWMAIRTRREVGTSDAADVGLITRMHHARYSVNKHAPVSGIKRWPQRHLLI